MDRPYHDVSSIISPAMFRNVDSSWNNVVSTAHDTQSHRSVWHEARLLQESGGRYGAEGFSEDRDGYTNTVTQPGSYRTPLRAKVAAIHAAREATSNLGYCN